MAPHVEAHRDERGWMTDKVVQWPCVSLWVMLMIPFAISILAAFRLDLEIDFDVSNFEIRSTHFSQQRLKSMREAIANENEFYTTRRRLWTNPNLLLGRLELIYAPKLAVDLIDRPEMVRRNPPRCASLSRAPRLAPNSSRTQAHHPCALAKSRR